LRQIFKYSSLLITLLFFVTLCNGSDLTPKNVLTGFNINWSFLPILDDKFINTTKLLKPKIIRYPGGTVSNFWDWQKGLSKKHPKRNIHKIKDLLKMQKSTNSNVIFVLNIISSTFQNQLKLLKNAKKIGIPIKYIELGNEQYLSGEKFQYNIKKFPTGKDYAQFVNTWAKKLKKEFPNVKIGIVLLGRTSNKRQRLRDWNKLVISNIKEKNYDAFIYHIYLSFPKNMKLNSDNIDKIVRKRTHDFEKNRVLNPKKEIWITEYGVHANSARKTTRVTKKLADYIESIANISMAHILFVHTKKPKHNFFSMISSDRGIALTELGKMFKNRVHTPIDK